MAAHRAIGATVKGLRDYVIEAKQRGEPLYVELYDPVDTIAAEEEKDGFALVAKLIDPVDGFEYTRVDEPYPRRIWRSVDPKGDGGVWKEVGSIEKVEGE